MARAVQPVSRRVMSRVGPLVVGLVLCGTRIAHAAPPRSTSLAGELDHQLGWVQGQQSGGVAVGATARLRYHVLTAGLSLQGATILFRSMGSVSTVAGVSVPVEFVRLDAFAELGVNAYTHVGSNFLTRDPGAGATLTFAGARASLLVRVAHHRGGLSVWIGPSVHYAEDLSSTTRTYTYRDQHQDWFDGGYTDEMVTRTVRIGQSRVSLLAAVSLSLPL